MQKENEIKTLEKFKKKINLFWKRKENWKVLQKYGNTVHPVRLFTSVNERKPCYYYRKLICLDSFIKYIQTTFSKSIILCSKRIENVAIKSLRCG